MSPEKALTIRVLKKLLADAGRRIDDVADLPASHRRLHCYQLEIEACHRQLLEALHWVEQAEVPEPGVVVTNFLAWLDKEGLEVAGRDGQPHWGSNRELASRFCETERRALDGGGPA